MTELWEAICAAWDDETMETDELRRLAAMLMPVSLLPDVYENIDAIILDV